MLWKTHFAIGLAVAIYFSSYVPNPVIFIPVVLIASLLPDVDSGFSFLGRKPVFRPLQWTTNHRGVIHSYTLGILVSFLIALFYPILALPFFIGYSFHLIADSFTVQGIKPFWPLKFVSKGPVKSGGHVDKTVFYVFVVIDVVLIGSLLYGLA
ncbi:MAG TPA: metal-dependent hydrolase [Candidatus Pacearchaeota archaeon]|nr:metal-dependent hydrolase [Candidatus Pacearchaeota archaeon]